jgi:hypothetical protein
MSRHYSPSTREVIGDLINGLKVETGILAAATYLKTGPVQTEIFTVKGAIKILHLFGEVTTVFANNACVLYYTFTSSDPAIAVGPLCAASASLAQLAVGERIMWVGGAVATAAVLTATPGISDINPAPQIVGTTGGTGTIGINTATATVATGALRFVCFYAPVSDGAYVETSL